MKANTRLLTGVLILSLYFISCYPKKEILGRYPNGEIKDIRHHKRNNINNERFVEYYDNGKKKYVRYWRNDLMQVYKMEAWYRSGAKRMAGWMKEKDSVRKYMPADSAITFTGLFKVAYKEWYENGKLKMETVNKDGILFYNYYDEQGVRTKQEFICGVHPDGYDTIAEETVLENTGKKYTKSTVTHFNASTGLLIRGDD